MLKQHAVICKELLKFGLVLCCFLVFPDTAWALQAHGAPEGLFVHQMAHIFVAFSMAYWFWDIKRSAFQGNGWRYLLIFCVLMLLWNVVAFIGHAMTAHLAIDHISTAKGYLHSRLVGSMNVQKIVYYVTRFDHFIIVPALFFLFLGVRSLYRDVEAREIGEVEK